MASPTLLSAKPVVEKLKLRLKEQVREFRRHHHRAPRLAVVIVGSDPASVIYTRKKGEMCVELGMEGETLTLPADATPAEVRKRITELNEDDRTDGILIQRPLPKSFREEEVLYWVDPSKDVDAFHPINPGRLTLALPCFQPCTPAGVMALLRHYQIDPAGKIACVIGRSSIVGKPMATLLLHANATVIHAHSRTLDVPSLARQADLLVVAAGKPGLVDATYVKPGAVVIDVGIHRNTEGKVVGDVKFEEVSVVASAITPVPGGVGPMTIVMLMENTLMAAQLRERARNAR